MLLAGVKALAASRLSLALKLEKSHLSIATKRLRVWFTFSGFCLMMLLALIASSGVLGDLLTLGQGWNPAPDNYRALTANKLWRLSGSTK